MVEDWHQIAVRARQSLLNSIPSKWRLTQPLDPSLTDVRSVPNTYGLLTERQLEITEGTASELYCSIEGAKAINGRGH